MERSDQVIGRLRAAVKQSPENAFLRHHLAVTLLGFGFAAEAEEEYREACRIDPRSPEMAFGLAESLYQQTKHEEALSLMNGLMSDFDPPASAYVLHARLLLAGGDVVKAREQYATATMADPSVAEPTLAEQLEARQTVPLEDGTYGHEDASESADTEFERPSISFADVGGMESVKEEVRLRIIDPVQHRSIFEAYGASAGGGILMYGPPGCGKTHLARATAGEADVSFLAVGITDILDMWLGNSEKNIHEVFNRARRNAPCVLFFDEVDALGASRSDLRHSASRHTINQFLEEMDGVKASNDGVLVLAATNAPWYVDSAFRRPGRFDDLIFVPPPDEQARSAIISLMLRGKPVRVVDYGHVASLTKSFSGADLRAMVDVAVKAKVKKAMSTGRPDPIETQDLVKAAERCRPTTSEWFATVRNYVEHANQSGIYDDVAKYLRTY